MFTDKLGGIELPYRPNIKIEENPKLFPIYAYMNLIWSQIIDFDLFLVTDELSKDKNFLHLIPFICS